MPAATTGTVALSDFNKYEASIRADVIAKKITYAKYQDELNAKAHSLLSGVNIANEEAAECNGWATLYDVAHEPKEAESAWSKYLTSNPAEPNLFNAKTSLANDQLTLNQTDDAKATVAGIQISDQNSANGISQLESQIADAIATKDGAAVGDDYLQAQMKAFPFAKYDADGTNLDAFTEERASLLQQENKNDEAKQIVQDALAKIPKTSPAFSGLQALNSRTSLYGSQAPELKVTNQYGDYTSLANLKGKVVVLDFFAHWCPPCRASMPDMHKMTGDLATQGLQVIGVTGYYGYYFDKRNISKTEEYADMKPFMKQYEIDHPVVYIAQKDFANYGANGIPEFVLIDRTGTVRDIQVGYDAPSFATFRKQVESVLAEKS